MPDDYQVMISADVSGLTGAMEEAGAATEQLKGQLESVGEAGEGAEGGLSGLGEALEGLTEKSGEGIESLGKLTEGWTGLLGVIGGGAIAELMSQITETTMEVGDAMRTTGAMLNVSRDDARGFNEAMESLGVSSQAATMAIRRLEMDASNGGKQLARLHVSATDLNGSMKSGAELFEEVTSKINNLADSGQKAEAAFTLLGRGGQQLLGVLPQLNEALEHYREEQEENSETNKIAAQQSLALHKVLTDLKSAWEDAIINIAPLVTAALEQVDAAIEEVKAFSLNCIDAVNALGAALTSLAQTATSAASQVVSAIGSAMDAVNKFGASIAGPGGANTFLPGPLVPGGGGGGGGSWANVG